MYELPETFKADIRMLEQAISTKTREHRHTLRQATTHERNASQLWDRMNFRERYLWGWFGGDKDNVAKHKELVNLKEQFTAAATDIQHEIDILDQDADSRLDKELRAQDGAYQSLLIPYEAAQELKEAVDAFLGKFANTQKEIDEAQTMETFDLFTSNKGIAVLSYLENDEAKEALEDIESAAPAFQEAVEKYNGRIKSADLPKLSSDIGDGIDLAFDFIFDGFDFMSIFTLSALDDAEEDLGTARKKVEQVDEMVTAHLDKAETAVKSYIRQLRLTCA